MFIKTYIVRAKTNPDIFYEVDAPCKWIAKWCGANLANWEYPGTRIAKDMSARRESKIEQLLIRGRLEPDTDLD